MKKKLISARFIIAVVTTAAQLLAVWGVWRWLLPALNIRLQVWVLIGILSAWLLFCVFLYISGTWALKTKEYAGLSSMVGLRGSAVDRLAPDGMVKIKGEFWKARAEGGTIEPGEAVTVSGMEGLNLVVRKTKQEITILNS
jgi:membrane-bound ClpP family serine protease